MTIGYRDAQLADAEAIDRIYRTGFCETFAHLYDPKDLRAFLSEFTLDRWRRELVDQSIGFRLAQADGQPIGYVKIGPISLPVEAHVPAMELKQLYIDKEWHGQGAAAGLVEWAIEQSRIRGAKELYLSVFSDNHRARRLYEHYGFAFFAPYTFMVGNHADDDIILRLEL